MTAPIHPAIDGGAGVVLPLAPMSPVPRVIHRHEIVPDPERWALTEETVPETNPHEDESTRLKLVFHRWGHLTGRTVLVGCNLAVRWDPRHPQYGVDPDVYIVEPPPPEGDEVRSLLLWRAGHVAPLLAVEIVSASHPTKDYVQAPMKYAACGVGELWILDRDLEGPRSTGGPFRIQVWRRVQRDGFACVYAGEGPAWSEAVGGWLRFMPDEKRFALSDDEAGRKRWLTPEEAERAEKERERAAKERERAAKERERAAKERERAAKEAALRVAEEERAEKERERGAREAAERRVRELEALLAGGR